MLTSDFDIGFTVAKSPVTYRNETIFRFYSPNDDTDANDIVLIFGLDCRDILKDLWDDKNITKIGKVFKTIILHELEIEGNKILRGDISYFRRLIWAESQKEQILREVKIINKPITTKRKM